MKKQIEMIVLAALSAVILTACTQADSGSSAGAGNSGNNGTGTIQGGASGSGTLEQSGAENNVGNVGTGSDAGTSSSGYVEVYPSGEDDFEGGVTSEPEQEVTEALQNEENFSDDQMNAMTEDQEVSVDNEGWAGTYENENAEILTVTMAEEGMISFSFANSGISGRAQINGSQAVYYGDDYHDVVFEYAGTDIKVTVTSQEDFDTSASPLNGVFVRQ